ncbi:MAG: glycosyltransferase family A protein [Thermoproteus sp.]
MPYLLEGLSRQTVKPYEVVVVLKPSGDGSEEVLERYSAELPIRIVRQAGGFAHDAYAEGIERAAGDLLLFIDDDAVPHPEWVARYIRLFDELPNAGAIGGLAYKAYLANGSLKLTGESLFGNEVTRGVFYRKPLRELADYCRYLSVSGLAGSSGCRGGVFKSVIISGMNMGFRREAIEGLDLRRLYRGSRRAFYFEFNGVLLREAGV